MDGKSDKGYTPEAFLMELPRETAALKHSAGKVLQPAPPPEIWQHFNANLAGRR